MTHAELEEVEKAARMTVAADDYADVPIMRQITNGLAGVLILLLGGIVVLAVVLWRSN